MGIVYLANNTGTAITSGSAIPMTTIVRRHNSCIDTQMNLHSGYYEVSAQATLVSTAGGSATIELMQDGTSISNVTGTIAANGTTTLNLDAVVRSKCCGSTLSLVYTGPVLTATTASVVIENA